jgi:hypothetical protein
VLVDDRGAPPALGALTYGGFNLTMAIGRFTGGSAGTVACAGITGLCHVNSTFIALLGAFAWGLGLSVVFPAVISAAAEVPGRGAAAIAQMASLSLRLFSSPGGNLQLGPIDRHLDNELTSVLLMRNRSLDG